MRYLLDVNVLIALADPAHVQHDVAHAWFARDGEKAWATCPITQNGLMRIVGHARYPNSPGTPAAVSSILASLCALPGHEFWADSISISDARHIDTSRLLSSGQITDSYLLALAAANKGRLATLDRKLVADAVPNGVRALCII